MTYLGFLGFVQLENQLKVAKIASHANGHPGSLGYVYFLEHTLDFRGWWGRSQVAGTKNGDPPKVRKKEMSPTNHRDWPTKMDDFTQTSCEM